MGRLLSQDYPYIGYVNIPPTITGLEYTPGDDTLTLTNSNNSTLQTTIEVPDVHLFKLTGPWSPTGTLADAYAIRVVDGVLGTSGSNQTLTPSASILGLGASSIASSGTDIPVTGSGIVWAKIIAPAISPGDNLQEYGIFFLNESCEPEDFSIVATGGRPSNPTYGGVVTITPTGFTSYAIANGVVANYVTDSFVSAVSAGDVLYVGFDRTNSKLVVQKDAGAVYDAALLTFGEFPTGETFFVSAYASFTSSAPVLGAGALEFDLSCSDGGRTPIQAVGSVDAPAGAEEGREYNVTSSGTYLGYSLKAGDIVKFYNGINDLAISRLPVVTTDDIPPGIVSVGYDVDTEQLAITRVFPDGRTDQVTTTIPAGGGGASGFACITDIVPQNIADNVGSKVTSDSGEVLASCTTGTLDIRVYVLATNGTAALTPDVQVNGVPVTNLAVAEARSLWEGYCDITIAGTSLVSVVHMEGVETTCAVTYEAPPAVTTAVFLGAYPAVGQTQYKSGATTSVQVGASTSFVSVEFQDAAGTATTALVESFAATTSHTSTVTIANRGNTTQALPARVRIQNSTGTWSPWFNTNTAGSTDHVHTVALNNTQPSLTFGTIDYPGSQLALKGAETASLPVTYTNVDTVAFTSAGDQVAFDAPTTVSDQVVTIAAGGAGIYNIATNNVTATVTRTANNASATFSTVVWIADVIPTIAITVPAARLRSGVTAQNYTVTISAQGGAQRTLGLTSLDADKGSWVGSWATSNNGATWTRTLQIADAVAKGTGTFSALTGLTTLALDPISIITTGDSYTVGGFVQRVVVFSPAFSREVDIGTYVSDTSKLRATNLSKGDSGTLNTVFEQSLADQVGAGSGPSKYAITSPLGVLNSQGRYLYNRDIDNVNTNTGGTAQWEIEEIV